MKGSHTIKLGHLTLSSSIDALTWLCRARRLSRGSAKPRQTEFLLLNQSEQRNGALAKTGLGSSITTWSPDAMRRLISVSASSNALRRASISGGEACQPTNPSIEAACGLNWSISRCERREARNTISPRVPALRIASVAAVTNDRHSPALG